jgi:hypothetical protein
LIIATSGWRAEVSFDGEPVERRLVIGPYWDHVASSWTDFRLRVLIFRSMVPHAPESDGDKVFEAHCTPDSFVHAVLKAAQAVWDEFGADGYVERWGGREGFPLRALSALKTALSLEEPPGYVRSVTPSTTVGISSDLRGPPDQSA